MNEKVANGMCIGSFLYPLINRRPVPSLIWKDILSNCHCFSDILVALSGKSNEKKIAKEWLTRHTDKICALWQNFYQCARLTILWLSFMQ